MSSPPSATPTTQPATPATKPAAAPAFRMPPELEQQIRFDAYCFTGETFPTCDFVDPAAARQVFGEYQLKAVFYDADGQQVARAARPGRYGAVVEIARGGRVSKRFATLCRVDGAPATGPTGEAPRDAFAPAMAPGSWDAIVAAARADQAAGRASAEESPAHVDRQWWVEFKRRYYGFDKLYPEPFVCPRPIDGAPAPVVHEGTLQQAGMAADAVQRIDAFCDQWVKEGEVGFSLCVVRRGVVVVNKGYGTQARGATPDAPYTAQTRGPLASLTKLLAATVMLEFVDQGLVGWDEPVDRYVPLLRQIQVARVPTIRQLYMHTAGLMGHWGDRVNDMEEVVADIYPTIRPGERHQYQGVGHALGSKIIEMMSGESLPRLYRKHLFDPLGCTNTAAELSSYGSMSTAEELARIGQLLLNGGSYGNQRFFGPEALRQMMPIPGHDRFDPDKTIRWGPGSKLPDTDGLSDQAFGHSGASGAWLFIDPKYDLVIAHTRFAEGRSYQGYLKSRGALFRTIQQAIADPGRE